MISRKQESLMVIGAYKSDSWISRMISHASKPCSIKTSRYWVNPKSPKIDSKSEDIQLVDQVRMKVMFCDGIAGGQSQCGVITLTARKKGLMSVHQHSRWQSPSSAKGKWNSNQIKAVEDEPSSMLRQVVDVEMT